MTSQIKDITPTGGAATAASQVVWFNGALVAEHETRVSPFDHGLLVGDGGFETLRTYGRDLFAMTRHYQRLTRTAARLGIDVPEQAELREAAEAVVDANGLDNARVRITVTGGPAPLGSEKGDDRSTVIVAAAPMPAWGTSAEVATVPYTRNETGALAGLKSTSYGENVIALAEAKRKGASEAVFGNNAGNVCEGSGSNLFLVIDDRVVTPPLTSGCLAGVTRGLVLELCGAEGIDVEETDRPMAILNEVDEAFLTSTTRDVQAIGAIDGRTLARVPGTVTQRLEAAFAKLVAQRLDP